MSHIKQSQHLKIKLEAIQSATNNFSDDYCIGRGGFGKVYKGELVHSKGESMVALKRLDRASIQGDPEFQKEVMMLSLYEHENIVRLLGYCDDDGEKVLAYEYLSNKSLDCYLASDDLTWLQRLKICVGAACGLAYLHTPAETQLRIVHRDIKSSNILLDNNWNAKISDFGLSKFTPANNQFTCVITDPAGTAGYIDPLYHETGLLTKESDVYSFGVVLFEVLCGRLCFANRDLRPLVGLVREYYEENKMSELVSSNIKNKIDITCLKVFADIAYRCLSRERKERPLMKEIVSTLKNALDIQEKAVAKAVHGVGTLYVKVHRKTGPATNIPFDAKNHYLILDISPSHHQPPTVNVEWEKEITLYVENFDKQELIITINMVESVNRHRYMGNARMKLSALTPEIKKTHFFGVKEYRSYFYNLIDLKVELLYKPLPYHDHIPTLSRSVQKAPRETPTDGGLLVIIIHDANIRHGEYLHLSATLRFRGELKKTLSITNTSDPRWLQEFTFMLEQPPTDETLNLEIIDDSWMGKIPGRGSFGCVDISLEDVISKKWTNELYQLKPGYKCDDDSYIYNCLRAELQWRTTD